MTSGTENSQERMIADLTAPPIAAASAIEPAPLTLVDADRLSVEYATTRDPRIREALILYHQRLVRSIAARFIGSDESFDDLVQVGSIGLINALDRYDPKQGTRFSTYATPTILGEIRRHFRDKAVGIKVPRWLQELQSAVRKASIALTKPDGQTPSAAEIAAHLSVSEEHVLAALESQVAVDLISLDSQIDGHSSGESSTIGDLIGRLDITLKEFEAFGDLRNALGSLGEREREVISMRFFDELSQAKIAQKLDISQMHVSRLQQRALKRLRDLLSDEPSPRTRSSAGRKA